METYYQGETIRFKIDSTDIDLSKQDIIVYIYKNSSSIIRIAKADMTISGTGYVCVIAPGVTKDMSLGCYTIELRIANTDVVILKSNCFIIAASVIKKENV